MAFVEQDVFGFDVAMHDVVPVGVIEGISDFGRDPHCGLDRQLSFLTEALAQGLSLHHRHHEVEEAVRFTGIVERQDVRVVEAGSEPDLPEKSPPPQRFGELGMEHLERDVAVVLDVVGEVDRGHPSRPELALDTITVGEGRSEARGVFGH